MRCHHWIAITILAGKIHLHGEAGHALEHELADHAGMPAGAAGGDGHLLQRADFVVRECEAGNGDSARRSHPALDDALQGFRLLINFLQHEVREAVLRIGLTLAHASISFAEASSVSKPVATGANATIHWINRIRKCGTAGNTVGPARAADPAGETPVRSNLNQIRLCRTTGRLARGPCSVAATQKTSFMPNCTWRPGLDELITPKVEPWKKLGRPRIGVFVRLMNWAIACRLVLSPSTMFFVRLRSAVASPGPRKEPTPHVPKVPATPGTADTGFQNCSPNCPPPRLTILWLPSCETPAGQLARGDALPVPDESGPSAVIAKPVWKVNAEASDQPPITLFHPSLTSPPNRLPLPKGRS